MRALAALGTLPLLLLCACPGDDVSDTPTTTGASGGSGMTGGGTVSGPATGGDPTASGGSDPTASGGSDPTASGGGDPSASGGSDPTASGGGMETGAETGDPVSCALSGINLDLPGTLVVTDDECMHEGPIGLGSDVMAHVEEVEEGILFEIVGDPGLGPVSGRLDSMTCSGNAVGTDEVAGFPDTDVEVQLTVVESDVVANITVGGGGNLPGKCPIDYEGTFSLR